MITIWAKMGLSFLSVLLHFFIVNLLVNKLMLLQVF